MFTEGQRVAERERNRSNQPHVKGDRKREEQR